MTEDGFVPTASCMTCHGRSVFDKNGKPTSQAGRLSFGPNGPWPARAVAAQWYWNFTGQPPIFEGKPGLTQIATSADFVWSIPFCAIDDTQNPMPASRCSGK